MTDGDLPQEVPKELEADAAIKAALAEFEARVANLEGLLAKNELSQEAKARDLLISEIQQRILIRQIAVAIAIVVMLFMAGVLAHATHSFFWGRFVVMPQSIAIAMFLGPIVSISTLAVVLIVGAFRRFKDEDMGKVSITSLAAEAARNSMS